jgi:hypothetical protein
MSGNIIFVLMYHRHKLLDLSFCSLGKEASFYLIYISDFNDQSSDVIFPQILYITLTEKCEGNRLFFKLRCQMM